jgi:hypothetical protein
MPETTELATKLSALSDSPDTFYNLEVIDDRS